MDAFVRFTLLALVKQKRRLKLIGNKCFFCRRIQLAPHFPSKFVEMSAVFFFVIVLSFIDQLCVAVRVPGNLSPFNWTSGGEYTATGTYSIQSTYPVTSPQPSAPIKLCVSPSNDVISLGTTDDSYGYQLVNDDAYYFWWPSKGYNCTYDPSWNFNRFVTAYAQSRQVSVTDPYLPAFARSHYVGLVRDPGTGPAWGASQQVTDSNNRVRAYILHQPIWISMYQFVGKDIQEVELPVVFPGVPASSCLSLPAACSGTPPSFPATFYPTNNALGNPIDYTTPV